MNFISGGNVYYSYFIGYGYKEDSTLTVSLLFVARENNSNSDAKYSNSIVDRKIEVSEAIVEGIDYAESIVDDIFSEEPSQQYFYSNTPITFALNSKSLARAIKTTKKITLKFDIIDYVYENEEDVEENYYIDQELVDSFKFDVVL